MNITSLLEPNSVFLSVSVSFVFYFSSIRSPSGRSERLAIVCQVLLPDGEGDDLHRRQVQQVISMHWTMNDAKG